MPVPAARPGRKHERLISLEAWQQRIADDHPADLLQGLFQSDGSRTNNWATRMVAGERKRYDYPRWEFVNRSDQIIDICTQALDRMCLHWTRPAVNKISVARASDVHRLDDAIGLKSDRIYGVRGEQQHIGDSRREALVHHAGRA